MNRRSLLAAAATVSVAGCVGAGGSPGGVGAGSDGGDDVDGDDGDTGSPEDGDANATETVSEEVPEIVADPVLQSTDLVEDDGKPAEGGGMAGGEAAIEFAPDEVAVAGTIVGETGCHSAEIANVTVDDAGAFRVVVAAVDRSAPDRLCTQSLTPIGYELEAQFEDGVPETVAVIHDDARGRETVATDRPAGA